MDKAGKVSVISGIILVGLVLAVIFHYVLGVYLNFPFPFNTFLFNPDIHFSDFTSMVPVAQGFAPFSKPNIWINYFPLAYILLFPFSLLKNNLLAYFIFASGFLVFLIYMNIKFFKCSSLTKLENFQNIFTLTILSYPVLYILDRGNFDMFLFVLFVGSVYFFKSKKYLLSAILLAIQNAIKPFPILFLVLFLVKKKYREFFLSLILTGLLIIGGFMVIKGGFFDNINVFIQNLSAFKLSYVYDPNNAKAMTNSSSLFMALKFLLCKYTMVISTIQLDNLYRYLSLIITSAVLFFTWRERIFWKQITLLTLLMTVLPYVVTDYKLIFLFVPIWLFINSEGKSKFDLGYAILFGLLMIPKQFFVLLVPIGNTLSLTTFGIIINPLLMLIFMGLIIFDQLYSKRSKKEAIDGN